jgi:hypothetical protein
VPQHPNPDIFCVDVVQEVVGKAIQITAPKAAPVKMETPGILDGLAEPDLKLREEVLPKLMRNVILLFQNLVQVRLNTPVESNFHVGGARPRAGRK